MKRLTFVAENLADTDRLGAALATCLPPGTVVALCGTLGSGKTRLVQGLAAACGVPRDDVVSPTFVLCTEYHGRRTIYHLDAYRLKDVDEFRQLGPEEYFESDGLTLVEWADRVRDGLPAERLEVQIEVGGESRRSFLLMAAGTRCESALDDIARQLTE